MFERLDEVECRFTVSTDLCLKLLIRSFKCLDGRLGFGFSLTGSVELCLKLLIRSFKCLGCGFAFGFSLTGSVELGVAFLKFSPELLDNGMAFDVVLHLIIASSLEPVVSSLECFDGGAFIPKLLDFNFKLGNLLPERTVILIGLSDLLLKRTVFHLECLCENPTLVKFFLLIEVPASFDGISLGNYFPVLLHYDLVLLMHCFLESSVSLLDLTVILLELSVLLLKSSVLLLESSILVQNGVVIFSRWSIDVAPIAV